MAKRQIVKGATSVILEVFIRDSSSSTGAGLTGLAHNSASLTCYYHRNSASAAVAVTLVTMTVGTFTSSGFKEVDATNLPGVYQMCLPDAAFASGAASVIALLKGATNMAPVPIEIELTAFDIQSAIAQTGDSYARLGAPAGASIAADVAARSSQTSVDTVAGYIDTEVAAIKAKTDQLTFTNTNKVDAAFNAAGDFPQAAADKVWSSTVRTLSAAGVQAIWDALTSALTTAGSIGKLIVDNVNASLSAIKAKTDQLTFTTTNRVDSQVFGMQADTVTSSAIATDAIGSAELAASAVTEIQNGLALASDLEGVGTTIVESLIGIADDLEAVKEKTDNLPASPAAVGSVMTLATDSVNASALAADAVAEIQSGLSTLTAAGVRTAVGLASANLDTQLDALPTNSELSIALAAADDANLAALASALSTVLSAISGLNNLSAAQVNAEVDQALLDYDGPTRLLDLTAGVETGLTLRQALRIIVAAQAGKLSGAATTTIAIRNYGDSKNRITATVDEDGNRSAVTYDLT